MRKIGAFLELLTSTRFFSILFLLLLGVAIPITIALIKQQQDLRKRAIECIVEVPISAKNPTTGECKEFPTPCDVPEPWQYVPSCNPTKIQLSLKLPGIGTDGNKNPRNPQRSMQVFLFNYFNQQIMQATSSATFDGMYYFKGEGNFGTDLRAGIYFVKVKLDNTLTKIVRENATILAGSSFPAPPTILISGDVNNDNSLDILDYNIFISCYGEKVCNFKQQSDFDDNASIEGVDYNILLRGFQAMLLEPPDVLPLDLSPYLLNITVNVNLRDLFPTLPPELQ